MSAALIVDWTRCDGHGLCAALLPGMITQDEWSYPVLRSPRVADLDLVDARRAVASCPALALRLEPLDDPAARRTPHRPQRPRR